MGVAQGVQAISAYLHSVGRFNPTAFLCTKYGTSELPQGFTRLAAIYGGTYVLGRGIQSISQDQGKCTGVVCSIGQELFAPIVVCDSGYVPHTVVRNGTSRGIAISDKPWIGDGEVSIITIAPSETHPHPVFLFQTNEGSGACPEGYFVLNAVSFAHHDLPEQDLQPVFDQFGSGLWSLFYAQDTRELAQLPEGVYVTAPPGSTLFTEEAIPAAQQIFETIYPGEEFLPAVPEPEDDELDM